MVVEPNGFFCTKCKTFFRLDGDRGPAYLDRISSSQASGKTTCPSCCEGTLYLTVGVSPLASKVVCITAHKLWGAINDMGLPGEEAVPERVKELFTTDAVVGADVSPSPGHEDRCVVHKLILGSGKVLHFASSGDGAVVYKITEE